MSAQNPHVLLVYAVVSRTSFFHEVTLYRTTLCKISYMLMWIKTVVI